MNKRPPEVVSFDIPARYMYLHLLSDCIADMLNLVEGIVDPELLIYNMQLAAHEVCTNIINHAYNKREDGRIKVKITLEFSPLRLIIELQDEGYPFDTAGYTSPNLDEVRVHGYGLFLIENLMDFVNYTSTPGCNHWCLTKNLFVERI